SGHIFDFADRVPRCTPVRLKSSVNAPTPCVKTSTRSPPEVRLPTVQYVRLPTEPSAKRKLAAMLFSPIGSALPVGSEYAETLTGSEPSSQYMRSIKWQASPRIAPPIAGSAIQYAPEIPGELTRHWTTAGAMRLASESRRSR